MPSVTREGKEKLLVLGILPRFDELWDGTYDTRDVSSRTDHPDGSITVVTSAPNGGVLYSVVPTPPDGASVRLSVPVLSSDGEVQLVVEDGVGGSGVLDSRSSAGVLSATYTVPSGATAYRVVVRGPVGGVEFTVEYLSIKERVS